MEYLERKHILPILVKLRQCIIHPEKQEMWGQRKQSKKDLLPGSWLGYLPVLFPLQIFWCMYALSFRTLLFNAVLGAETTTLIFPKTFQPQTVGRKKKRYLKR